MLQAHLPGAAPSRASDEDAAARLAICADCPFYRKKIGQCKKCGCVMPQKVKLAGAVCPVGKWGTVEAVK